MQTQGHMTRLLLLPLQSIISQGLVVTLMSPNVCKQPYDGCRWLTCIQPGRRVWISSQLQE